MIRFAHVTAQTRRPCGVAVPAGQRRGGDETVRTVIRTTIEPSGAW